MNALVVIACIEQSWVPGILMASTAVAEQLTVLHDDRDVERIRDVHGAPAVERLVPDRGSG